MVLENIEEYVCKKLSLSKATVSFTGNGQNNNNYLIKSGSFKAILRMVRTDVSAKDRLYDEHRMLKFLEYKNIEFAPKSLFYDAKNGVHIISFIEGKLVHSKRLNFKQFKLACDKLTFLNSVSFKEFTKFCKENKFKKPKVVPFLDILDEYTVKPFEFIEKNGEKDIVDWLKPRVKEIVSFYKKQSFENAYLFHGDLGENIFYSDKDIVFIDWEASRFMSYILPECANLLSRKSSPKRRVYVKEICKKMFNYSNEEIDILFSIDSRSSVLAGILWFGKRMLEMRKDGAGDWKSAQKEMKQRIKKYARLEKISAH